MSAKRKRAIDVEPDVSTPSASKRKKGRLTMAEKQKRDVELAKGEYVIRKLKRAVNPSKKLAVDSFIRLPSRRLDSNFYEKVKDPIDITTIQLRLKTPDYMTFQEFCDDINLLIKNTLGYYKKESEEFKDMKVIEQVFKESKLKVENDEYEEDDEVDDEEEEDKKPEVNKVQEESEDEEDDDREESPFEIDIAMIETILLSILECTDKTGRLLCPPFKILQPEDEFPLYYEKIKNPIDLKTIAERGREGKYQTMQELKSDLKLLFSNAQTFSGKGTDIYKDAEQLKSCMREEIRKIEEKRIHPLRRQKAHRLVDALLEESAGSDDYSEDSEEDEDTENNSDPLWQMYWTIRNAKHEKDRTITLADNFLELPSRAMYHDYFDEIETPISLFMINKKLKNGELDMRGLVKDLLQMFSNACEYNLETSGVYIAAKKLEQITLITLKKLAPELVAEFGSRLYVPPQQQQPANNIAAKTPFKGRPKIKMEYDSEDSRTPPPTTLVKRKRSPKKSSEPGYVETRGRKSNFEIHEMNKQKMVMLSVWNAVHNYKPDPTGMYWPCGAFIELPTHKEYPEYYRLIRYPIDMTKIKQRLDSGKYKVAGDMVDQMRIMFNNAREFNEPGSQIHQDACRLEEVMRNSYEAMMSASLTLGSPPKTSSRSKSSVKRRHHDIETDTDEDSRGPPTPNMRNYRSTPGGYPQQYGMTAQQFQSQKIERVINSFSEEEGRMWKMFQAIKDCRDDDGRHVAVNFWRLPNREELPSYYDVIKRPMDLTKIQNKLKTKSYLTLQDIFADFSLMLSNACKFNEPDSAIYKNAVHLQRNLFELKRDLDRGDKVPKVQLELRTIFTSIFATIFNKKDENGACYSDTFTELAELLKTKGVPETEWPYTFDQIKINIDKCRYRRLDRFQKDFFNLCETARQVSKIGSPIYEASIVLQKLFIVERDKKCRESIKSNAYIVIEKDIDEAIEFEAVQRAKEEANEDEESSSAAAIKRHESEVDVKKVVHNDVEYSPPCYAYISRTDERKSPLHIFRIERVFINENGDEAVQGLWVYRPEETLHLANRKFMKKEVFITPFRDTVLANRLRGSCVVVGYQTFVGNKIGSFDEDDIYVCESKYYGKPKYFGKLKWPYSDEDEALETEKRDRILSPKRLTSKIEQSGENRKNGSDSDDDDDADEVHEIMLDIHREETPASSSKDEAEGRTYFHQIKTKTSKFYTLGQFVLVFNANKPLCDVMRIHKLWRERDGSEWFSGGWFARPIETIHDKNRLFYTREVIAVYRNDEVRQISEIQGLCDVLNSKTYPRQRQTDISEYDVFMCDTMVHGTKDTPDNCLMFETTIEVNPQEIVPMNLDYAKPCRKLKTFRLLQSIPNEELYYFKQPITMEKEISPLTKTEGGHVPLDHLDDMLDDDTDGSESVASTNLTNQPPTTAPTPTPKAEQQSASPPAATSTTAVPTTPTPQETRAASSLRSTPAPPGTQLVTTAVTIVSSLASVTPKAVKSKSGYILFSAEVRKRIMQENPDSGFGEVSKIVGIEWKKLSDEQKKQYEQRAEIVAQEKAKLDAIKLAAERALQPGQVRIYQCKWANCDSQFDAETGLSEHIVQHHTSQIIMDSEQQYVCMWMTCLRNRKDGKSFPSLPRLHRHMKEKHVPTACRNVYQNQIGKNFFKIVMNGEVAQLINAPYGRLPPPGAQQQVQTQQQQQQQTQHVVVQQQPQVNGVNGHHHHQHHATQAPQQLQYQQNGIYHHQGPSSSQAPQIAPQPQQYQQQQQHTVHQVVHQPSQHVVQQQQQAQQPQQQAQQQQAQVIISDPGRTIVRAVVPAFVAPPNSIHSRRVLHSEAYLKYIESLATNRQKSVSRWEKSLGATHRNTQQGPAQQNGQRVPTHWIKKNENGRPVAREEDVTRALWKLRDELLQSTCNVLVDRQPF